MRPLIPFAFALAVAGGCVDQTSTDSSDLRGGVTCLHCSVCAIATFDGPDYYAHNFDSYHEAEKWLAQFGPSLTGKEIVNGACAANLACPDVYQPLCGQISGSDPQTYGNTCELLASTRTAAGAWAPGEAKGATLYTGECKIDDPCADKKCGESCDGPQASPLPTYCDASGACVAGAPSCPAPAYDCDLSQVACDIAVQQCDPGYTPSVSGLCYGPCVPVEQCKCDPGNDTQCPDGYACWAGTNRCGPYVK